jgi:CHAD domain-containing protein
MSKEQFKTENSRLRFSANSLSAARDAEVMLQTLKKLRKRTGHKKRFSAITREFKQWLKDKRKKRLGELNRTRIKETIERLGRSRKKLMALKLQPSEGNDLETSIATMLRNARKNFIRAYRDDEPEAYHDYRKSVQLYHRQMQLLANVWPDLIRVYIKAAKNLSEILGEQNDLAVLNQAILSHRKLFPNKEKMALVSELIEGRQKELQAMAFIGGRRLFMSEKPKAFALRMVTYLENSEMKPSDF